MLPEEKTLITITTTSQDTSQHQSNSSQYGYGIVEGSSSTGTGYPSGSGSGSGWRETSEALPLGLRGENEGLNVTIPIDSTMSSNLLRTPSASPSSIPGGDYAERFPINEGPGFRTPGMDRVSEYEAWCMRNPVKGGKSKGKAKDPGMGLGKEAEMVQFRVKKTIWGDRVASPIARFPNEVLTHTFSFLDPVSLSSLSLVSRRFYTLISSPHAWRSAFARYFPEQAQLSQKRSISPAGGSTPLRWHDEETRASYSSERRYFTRLVAESTWRKEYLLRTALLRSLSRGKAHVPHYAPPKHPESRNYSNAGSIITYPGCTGGNSVTHISATFPPIDRSAKNGNGNGQGKAALRPHLMHGSYENGIVANSDPTTGRIDRVILSGAVGPRPWFTWPVPAFAEHRPGIELGSSVMDLSDELGWCIGETVPGGRVYIEPKFLATTPIRGVFLPPIDLGYPKEADAYISSIWIAKKKSKGVFETSNWKCGLLVGESMGRVTMYPLPTTVEQRDNSNLWADAANSWIVSPGVPILSIKVDENYSVRRQRRYKQRKEGMVVVVVNALGEVWYLRDLEGPWRLVEQTRRTVKYMDDTDSKEVETERGCMRLEWERVEMLWNGWGMDYFIEVDFAGGNIILGKKGRRYVDPVMGETDRMDDGDVGGGWVKCFHLAAKIDMELEKLEGDIVMDIVYPPLQSKTNARSTKGSNFGGSESLEFPENDLIDDAALDFTTTETLPDEDTWTGKQLSFSHDQISQKAIEISAFSIDKSNFSTLSAGEDPHVNGKVHDLPGLNARLFAVGTATGSIFVWNIRSPVHTGIIEQPLRIIHTESPIITTLGLTSLYLIHGGNDGLVQCWDPLASTLEPIRTIHSRFSTRARRRMAQAELNRQNLAGGDNQYAARAVQLDPDPTVLRGVIALGTYVRYWSFAGDVSSAINGKRKKKLGRRAGVGGGVASSPGRGRLEGNLRGEISSEIIALEKEKARKKKEEDRLREMFGVPGFGFGELSEEEMILYARMLSEEAFDKENRALGSELERGESGLSREPRASSDEDEEAALAAALAASASKAADHMYHSNSSSVTTPTSVSVHENDGIDDGGGGGDIDMELAEAIRLSLLDTTPGEGVSFRYSYDDDEPSAGASGTSTAVAAPFNVPGPSQKIFVNPVTPAKEESASDGTPPASAWAKTGSWGKTSIKKKGTQKWAGGGGYADEWPSPRHAASISGDKFDDGAVHMGSNKGERGSDEDLEFVIRLSLAEEESRRLAAGVGGGGEDDQPGVTQSSRSEVVGGAFGGNIGKEISMGVWGSKGKGRGV